MRDQLPYWRTAIVVLLLSIVLLVALVLCLHFRDPGSALFSPASTAIVSLAIVAASKSAVEHLAGGGGVAGAMKALFTSSKPEAPPPAPGAQP